MNTDELEIQCGICHPTFKSYTEYEMYKHIKLTHPEYNEAEARDFAHCWTESAFEVMDEERYETMLERKKAMLGRSTCN